MDQNEREFRACADALPVMLWMAGADGRWKYFNKRWLDFTGRSLEYELVNGWMADIHAADVEVCRQSYLEGLKAQREFEVECRLRRSDGEYCRTLVSGAPQFSLQGRFTGFVGTCVSVGLWRTRRAITHNKLETIGSVVGGIAHDFNNLLSSIIADAEVALAEPLAASARETMERIRTTAIRTSEIAREFMVYSGDEARQIAPLDISLLIEEMLDLLKVSITKNARLTTALADNPPPVYADAAEVRQVLMNLVLNASDAVEANGGGEIHVGTWHTKADGGATDCVRIEVSDSGRGIPTEVQARMFEPLFTTKRSGRGLGLNVVRRIVRRYGGTIECQSSPGEGARFIASLPCASATAVHQPAEDPAPPTPVPAGATVLVVEDEETLRAPIAKLLRRRGIRVVEAADGRTALELLERREHAVDAMLVDLTLPGISGGNVVAEAIRIRPDIKIILTSAYGTRGFGAAVSAAQVKAFIRKPFEFRELTRVLGEVLNGSTAASSMTGSQF